MLPPSSLMRAAHTAAPVLMLRTLALTVTVVPAVSAQRSRIVVLCTVAAIKVVLQPHQIEAALFAERANHIGFATHGSPLLSLPDFVNDFVLGSLRCGHH